MTRFELASRLSRGLSQLEEGEKHNVINMYIADINRRIENGESEKETIEKLGDVDTLIANILKSYGIEAVPEEKVAEPPTRETEVVVEEAEDEKIKSGNKYYDLKNRFITAKENRKENFEDRNKGKDLPVKKEKSGFMSAFLKDLWRAGANFTFTLTNLLVFIFIWMPCMAITALGFITTAAVTIVYMFSGIGFLGICIAGLGCCIVGASFCIWLGGAMSRGKRYE